MFHVKMGVLIALRIVVLNVLLTISYKINNVNHVKDSVQLAQQIIDVRAVM